MEVGTLLQSRDPTTGEKAVKPVTNLLRYEDRSLYGLVFIQESGRSTRLESSDNHLFWVEGHGWVESAKLMRGMKVPTFNGELLTVVQVNALGRTGKTYNLTVADFHTFFAGERSAYVHNECLCTVAAGKTLFRGGNGLAARLGADVTQAADGLIHPLGKNGKPQGLSLNLDPKEHFVQRYGGAFPVESLPEGLKAVASGKPGHFVVAPAAPMTFEAYQGLLNRIQLGNFNVLP